MKDKFGLMKTGEFWQALEENLYEKRATILLGFLLTGELPGFCNFAVPDKAVFHCRLEKVTTGETTDQDAFRIKYLCCNKCWFGNPEKHQNRPR